MIVVDSQREGEASLRILKLPRLVSIIPTGFRRHGGREIRPEDDAVKRIVGVVVVVGVCHKTLVRCDCSFLSACRVSFGPVENLFVHQKGEPARKKTMCLSGTARR